MAARTIVFHTLEHTRAALAAATHAEAPVILRSAPGASAYAGAQYLKAMVEHASAEFPDADFTAVIDCGDDPGHAQGALRIGWKVLLFGGPEDVRSKIADIAEQHGARLVGDAGETLDLLDLPDSEGACRNFLERSD